MSDSPNITFMHIPKTAGTSLIEALKSQYDQEEVSPFLYEGKTVLENPGSYKLIAGHVGFSLCSSFHAPIITILRDPLERVLSLYYFWQHSKRITKFDNMTLDDFVKSDHPGVVANIENTQTKQVAHSTITRDIRQLRIKDDALLDRAMKNLESVAIVGVTERIDVFTAQVCERFNLQLPELQTINKVKTRRDVSEVSEETKAVIANRTRLDRLLYDHVASMLPR